MIKKIAVIVGVVLAVAAIVTSFLLGYAYTIQSLRTMRLGRRIMHKYLEQDISLDD